MEVLVDVVDNDVGVNDNAIDWVWNGPIVMEVTVMKTIADAAMDDCRIPLFIVMVN